MKLRSVTLSKGLAFEFIPTQQTDQLVNYQNYDGYIEYWDDVVRGMGQAYFIIDVKEDADIGSFSLTRRNPDTRKMVPLSERGRRTYALLTELVGKLQEHHSEIAVLGIKFFFRPQKEIYSSHMSIYTTESGRRRWNFSIDKSGYFQDEGLVA